MVSDQMANDESNGGENNYSELHKRVQDVMRPYTGEILEADCTGILAEDDETWYLNVHWGEWESLLSDGILTSEEFDAISSEHHAIVSEAWRNDDPENRWSNAAPYGDGHAMVLEKPDTDGEDDSSGDESCVSGSVRISSGDCVDADTPVDATALQMVKIEERTEVINVCATIIRESDVGLTPTLIDMLDEISDRSEEIQMSARDIMVTDNE